jgi:hypothetical protein
LRHSKTSDRVHHQKNRFALIAETFGQSSRGQRGLDTNKRWLLASRTNDNRPLQTLFPKVILHELADFPSTFTNQTDDVDLRFTVTSDHAQQSRLSNARTRKDTHALTFAQSEHSVNRPNSGRQRLLNHSSRHCVRRVSGYRIVSIGIDRRSAIHWVPEPVQNTPQHRIRNWNRKALPGGLNKVAGTDSI